MGAWNLSSGPGGATSGSLAPGNVGVRAGLEGEPQVALHWSF